MSALSPNAQQSPAFTLLIRILLLIIALMAAPVCAQIQPNRPWIHYFNSAAPEDYWWRTSSEIMQAACDNLGMRLTVQYLERNHVRMIDEFRKLAEGANRPDAVVFQSLKLNGPDMLKIAEQAKIPAFIFNAGLTEKQSETYGRPRERFKYWIGQMLPDDRGAGYTLAKTLLRQAQQEGLTDGEGKVRFIAIGGTSADGASIERLAGLAQAADEEPALLLQQIAPAHWQRDMGKKVFLGLFSRYPDTAVVWAANDLMALGVLEGMQERQIGQARPVLVGAFDWEPEAIRAVQQKRMVTTLGGHFMETAWVAVLLHDYFRNKDFGLESAEFRSEMSGLSSEGFTAYLEKFIPANFSRLDFRRYSKVWNPQLERYRFSFKSVLDQLNSAAAQR